MGGIIGGVVGAVGSVVGGITSRNAAKSAASAQTNGIREQIAFQREAMDATNRLLAPARQIGYGAQNMLSKMFLGTESPLAVSGFGSGSPSADIPSLFDDDQSGGSSGFTPGAEEGDFSGFTTSPGYEFRQEEGAKALTNRQSALGLQGSGRGIKDFMRFNQGLASEEFNNFTNQLFNLAGFGQTATSNTASALLSTGGRVGDSLANAGTARASGIVGANNAISSAITGLPGSIAGGFQLGNQIENGPQTNPLLSAASMQQFANGSAFGAF